MAAYTRDVICSPQALQKNQCPQQLKSALEHSGTTLPDTASSVHDTSLVNFTPSRCSCGPDNSTDIWLICSTPMLVFTLRAYGSLSAWRIRPSATSRLALDAIHASSCKSPQWRAQMRRQVPDGQARAVAYVRYLPVHVLVDHSLDTSDVRARQHQRLQPASSQNDVAR